jgi:hypothetical protein
LVPALPPPVGIFPLQAANRELRAGHDFDQRSQRALCLRLVLQLADLYSGIIGESVTGRIRGRKAGESVDSRHRPRKRGLETDQLEQPDGHVENFGRAAWFFAEPGAHPAKQPGLARHCLGIGEE